MPFSAIASVQRLLLQEQEDLVPLDIKDTVEEANEVRSTVRTGQRLQCRWIVYIPLP